MFTDHFSTYVCDGDEIHCQVDGLTAVARVKHDNDFGSTPWEVSEGHGPVSEWTTRAKRPGERILDSDRDSHLYYDWQAAIRIAKRDGWDAPPYRTGTRGEQALRAVAADFKYLRAWCQGDWYYVGVSVTVFRDDVKLGSAHLWGIDANSGPDNRYLTEVANELLPEALAAAREKLASLRRFL